ncbi:D-2-hydroxyacid dehydrogenase [Bacillus marasmi]|uniref:D-2-hydroxyacid dehydrogenase n=1 Tax=Bacillus marasmi TaxID=1926279 RepID=UPI0011C9AD15|nr:D-2-hydroxyacid dehydrogenase [Bacillus marasmi]
MEINNILVVSPMFKQLQQLIEAEKLQKQFRYSSEQDFNKEALAWADALVAFNLKDNFDYSHVKWVHSLGAGVDRFLYQKKWDENVLLTRTICSFGQRIAQYCLSYILKDIQLHDTFHKNQLQKRWEPKTPKLLQEHKVMIFGTGEIGQTVAKIFSELGMTVYGVSLSGAQKVSFHEVLTMENFHSHLSDVNYIINTMPLTEKTSGFFNEDFFKCVHEAGFINVGRGASVNERALLEAIGQKRIKFAVLDVFSVEPLSIESLLWEQDNVYITPHISAVTTPEEGFACFIQTLNNIENNLPLNNQVDVKKGY